MSDAYVTVTDYMQNKTFKLPDTYIVTIEDTETDWDTYQRMRRDLVLSCREGDGNRPLEDFVEFQPHKGNASTLMNLKNCIDVGLPKYEPKEQKIEFCNTTRLVLLPNTDDPPPLKLKIAETKYGVAKSIVSYLLRKNFIGGYDEDVSQYNPFRKIHQITVDIYNNNLENVVLSHRFYDCKLTGYDINYELGYSENGNVQMDLEFSFMKYVIDTKKFNPITNGAPTVDDLRKKDASSNFLNLELDPNLKLPAQKANSLTVLKASGGASQKLIDIMASAYGD